MTYYYLAIIHFIHLFFLNLETFFYLINEKVSHIVLLFCLEFSGKDNMLPSKDEGQRLLNSLKNCRVRYLKDNGHTLLLVSELI